MLGHEFLQSAVRRFHEEKSLGDKTLGQLNDAELLTAPNEACNSIAVIIQHLHGNMRSRWINFLTEDGEKSWRNRDEEFEQRPLSKEEVLQLWEDGWTALFDALGSLTAGDLLKTITIRTQPLVVVDAVNRQLAHYSYHVGQIVLLGKWLKNDKWMNLSIPKGNSQQFNQSLKEGIKS